MVFNTVRSYIFVSRRAAAGVSLLSLLAGCAVGPDFSRPAPPETKDYVVGGTPQPNVPNAADPQQRFAVGKRIAGDWWRLFRSAQLDGVVQQALAGNQTLAAAQATLAQSQQTIVQARGILFPQVDLNAGVSRGQQSLVPFGINSHSAPQTIFTIGPTVSYALDPFGGNRRRVEQQEALAGYADYQLDAAYLTLTGNAVTQAIQIASARAQIAAAEQIIADDEHNLELIQGQLRAGEATRMDVQIAMSQLETDRTLLPPLRQQLSVAQNALAVLLGKSPGDWVPPDFDFAEFTLPEELPVTLPSDLVRQRPDILASEAQLHAASAAIGVATAQLYPNLNLSASFTQESLSASTLFNPMSSVWSIGAQILAPLFHGGTLWAQKKAAVDAYDGALANYKQTVLTSFGQVADVLQGLGHDAELLEAQRRALDSAETSLRLTRTTFRYGSVGVLQVLDAQRQAEQARLGLVRAQAQRYLDTAQLFSAMGGGWWDWKNQTAQAEPQAGAAPASR